MTANARALLPAILELHNDIRSSVITAFEQQQVEAMSAVAHDDAGDTIYAVDRISEETLVRTLNILAERESMVLIAEGLPSEGMVLPRGTREQDCKWRIIVDPIDGTRGLMYQKRPAWILTGVAPNKGRDTRLSDIILAVQSEIPLIKQHLCDQVSAVRGEGVQAHRHNRLTGTSAPLVLRASTSDTISHGFASVSRFFPGARDILASIDDEIAIAVGGPLVDGKALCFEDQYISTGGQLYELMSGHDRFIADIRPLLANILHARGLPQPLCCHPYDLCTALIGQELGLSITDPTGAPLDAPLDLESDVSWVGYANSALHSRIQPALRAALESRNLI